MRRLLVLAYHFPPIGGAGAQRTVKLVRDLPALGYEPVVVTGSGTAGDAWSPPDASLAAELGAVEVLRARGAVPAGGAAWARRLARPSPRARWWAREAEAAGRRAGDVDAIYASLPPYEGAGAAAALGATLRRPWIADLRDPWAFDELRTHPSALHARLDRHRMRRALAGAALVVLNTPEAARRVREAFPELAATRTVVVPNGWDPADIEAAAVVPITRPSRALQVVHTGSLHTTLGLRRRRRTARVRRRLLGGDSGVDALARSHLPLLAALRRLGPAAAEVELHLAGSLSPDDRRTATAPGAAGAARVHLHGYVPHAESVALLRGADLLYLPLHGLPAGRRATVVPGKTFEYLATGRPVLAAVPPGDARDLLAACAGVTVCAPGDVAALAAALEEALTGRRADGEGRTPDAARPQLARYERIRLAAELAAHLDAVLGTQPRRPRARVPR